MMQSTAGRFLTGSPIMRTGYALLKAFTFGWLLMISGLDKLQDQLPFVSDDFLGIGYKIGYVTAIISAIVCIVRGIPPIVEGAILIRDLEEKPSS
jgi:uncharacterized membrane protein YphA (DoxX/SURF4 family)